MSFIRVTVAGFLNDASERESLARLGQAALDGGLSDGALRALVRLTCQAHGIKVTGLNRTDFDDRHLREMRADGLIYRPRPDQVKMI